MSLEIVTAIADMRGIASVLHKPFRIETLLQAMEAALCTRSFALGKTLHDNAKCLPDATSPAKCPRGAGAEIAQPIKLFLVALNYIFAISLQINYPRL